VQFRHSSALCVCKLFRNVPILTSIELSPFLSVVVQIELTRFGGA
jgi:hypothetical protein